jgi:hypothetical protein
MSDDEIWDAFSRSEIQHAAWTHEAHLRIAWLYMRSQDLDGAHLLMRAGIIRLNAFHGLVETPQRGYHETITRAWLAIIGGLSREHPARTSREFLAAVAASITTTALFRHYSRERLLTPHARARFIEPDLALP